MRRALPVLLAFGLAGCSYIPWHPFGSPLTRVETAEAKVASSEKEVLSAAQQYVHKFNFALSNRTNLLSVDVAAEFGRQAEAALDQVLGQPKTGDEHTWRELVSRLISENEKVRSQAQKDSASIDQRIDAISGSLDKERGRAERAEKKALEYAAEKEHIADSFLKLCWAVGVLVGLYFLGQILAFLAHFSPAFAPASNAINAVVSPALHSIAHRAEKKLSDVLSK